jgi:tetratricopeptide (TPR) repeat protein
VYAGSSVALVGWTALTSTIEAERAAAYALAIAGSLCIVYRPQVAALLGGLTAATALVAAYALATRLVPDRLGAYDSVAGYRLSEPLGYWNALGIFVAIGVLLALGFASAASSRAGRSVAAALVPGLLMCAYFTFSRGTAVALVVGCLATVALLSGARFAYLRTVVVVTAPSTVAIIVVARYDALTTVGAPLAEAASAGRTAAAWLAAASIASAAGIALAARWTPGRASRRIAFAVAMSSVALVLVVGAQARTPTALARDAWTSFSSRPPETHGNLNQRLMTVSSNGRLDLWKVAWPDRRDLLRGSGAGSFEAKWLEKRPFPGKVRDAHSLYLEAIDELGIVGLALLLLMLAVPLYAAVKARRQPLVPIAFGAYVAYLVHAGIDWDWEMATVTLTALFIGVALVAANPEPARPLSPKLRAGACATLLALVAFAFVGLVGNMSLSESARAARAGHWRISIERAERAKTWAPWSSEPYERIGDAELALGRSSRARASYKKAIAKAPGDWSLWFDLARASTGRERRSALARASALNPRSPEIRQFRNELAQGPIAVVPSEGSP